MWRICARWEELTRCSTAPGNDRAQKEWLGSLTRYSGGHAAKQSLVHGKDLHRSDHYHKTENHTLLVNCRTRLETFSASLESMHGCSDRFTDVSLLFYLFFYVLSMSRTHTSVGMMVFMLSNVCFYDAEDQSKKNANINSMNEKMRCVWYGLNNERIHPTTEKWLSD